MQNPLTSSSVAFDGITLDVIDHAGQRWLTADQIGRCLGYAPDKARTAVTNLYGRHKDEFSEGDTCAIKLMAGSRGEQITRIFSVTGCILLTFFANTKKAGQFRAWAKQVLADGSAMALGADAQSALIEENERLREALLDSNPFWRKIARCRLADLNTHEIARVIKCGETTVRRHIARMREYGLLPSTSIESQAVPREDHPQLALHLLDAAAP